MSPPSPVINSVSPPPPAGAAAKRKRTKHERERKKKPVNTPAGDDAQQQNHAITLRERCTQGFVHFDHIVRKFPQYEPLIKQLPRPRLPFHERLPPFAKFPVAAPHGVGAGFANVWEFATTKLGVPTLPRIKEAEFDLSDPYCLQYDALANYNPLNDPHLKHYLKRPHIWEHLREHSMVTQHGRVKCSLREFNLYRHQLYKSWLAIAHSVQHDARDYLQMMRMRKTVDGIQQNAGLGPSSSPEDESNQTAPAAWHSDVQMPQIVNLERMNDRLWTKLGRTAKRYRNGTTLQETAEARLLHKARLTNEVNLANEFGIERTKLMHKIKSAGRHRAAALNKRRISIQWKREQRRRAERIKAIAAEKEHIRRDKCRQWIQRHVDYQRETLDSQDQMRAQQKQQFALNSSQRAQSAPVSSNNGGTAQNQEAAVERAMSAGPERPSASPAAPARTSERPASAAAPPPRVPSMFLLKSKNLEQLQRERGKKNVTIATADVGKSNTQSDKSSTTPKRPASALKNNQLKPPTKAQVRSKSPAMPSRSTSKNSSKNERVQTPNTVVAGKQQQHSRNRSNDTKSVASSKQSSKPANSVHPPKVSENPKRDVKKVQRPKTASTIPQKTQAKPVPKSAMVPAKKPASRPASAEPKRTVQIAGESLSGKPAAVSTQNKQQANENTTPILSKRPPSVRPPQQPKELKTPATAKPQLTAKTIQKPAANNSATAAKNKSNKKRDDMNAVYGQISRVLVNGILDTATGVQSVSQAAFFFNQNQQQPVRYEARQPLLGLRMPPWSAVSITFTTINAVLWSDVMISLANLNATTTLIVFFQSLLTELHPHSQSVKELFVLAHLIRSNAIDPSKCRVLPICCDNVNSVHKFMIRNHDKLLNAITEVLADVNNGIVSNHFGILDVARKIPFPSHFVVDNVTGIVRHSRIVCSDSEGDVRKYSCRTFSDVIDYLNGRTPPPVNAAESDNDSKKSDRNSLHQTYNDAEFLNETDFDDEMQPAVHADSGQSLGITSAPPLDTEKAANDVDNVQRLLFQNDFYLFYDEGVRSNEQEVILTSADMPDDNNQLAKTDKPTSAKGKQQHQAKQAKRDDRSTASSSRPNSVADSKKSDAAGTKSAGSTKAPLKLNKPKADHNTTFSHSKAPPKKSKKTGKKHLDTAQHELGPHLDAQKTATARSGAEIDAGTTVTDRYGHEHPQDEWDTGIEDEYVNLSDPVFDSDFEKKHSNDTTAGHALRGSLSDGRLSPNKNNRLSSHLSSPSSDIINHYDLIEASSSGTIRRRHLARPGSSTEFFVALHDTTSSDVALTEAFSYQSLASYYSGQHPQSYDDTASYNN